MGIPSDAAPTAQPLDVSEKVASNPAPMRSLGGDLLTSRSPAVTQAAGSENGLHPVTLVENKTASDVLPGQVPLAQAPVKTDLERQQEAYDIAHRPYEKELKTYWDDVAAGKKSHHYVMDFPPIYEGPAKPKLPGQTAEVKPNSIPTINQMLEDASHLNQFASGDKNQPLFKLRDVSESEFKQRYAEEATRVGKEHGLSKEQVHNFVRDIYAFEDGGWGTHETLSSMPQSMVKEDKPGETKLADARRNFHLEGATASSALGYNQLLMANTLAKFEEQPAAIAGRLKELSLQNPARAGELQDKAQLVEKLGPSLNTELMAMARENAAKPIAEQKEYLDKDGKPTELLYREFGKSTELTAAGMTRQDMARGIHGLNLDGDIGPIVQAQEFGNLLKYADQFGYQNLLKGREQADNQALSQYDALPAAEKSKAIREVFDLIKPPISGSATTPEAVAAEQIKAQELQVNKAALEAKILDAKPGVDETLSKAQLSPAEEEMTRLHLLTLKGFGEASGRLSPDARLLMNKIAQSYYGGLDSEKLTPAALELANLSGPKSAQLMLDEQNHDVPTPNFFSQAGYNGNPVTKGRTASELLLQIERAMQGPNNDVNVRPGQADFDQAFKSVI